MKFSLIYVQFTKIKKYIYILETIFPVLKFYFPIIIINLEMSGKITRIKIRRISH